MAYDSGYQPQQRHTTDLLHQDLLPNDNTHPALAVHNSSMRLSSMTSIRTTTTTSMKTTGMAGIRNPEDNTTTTDRALRIKTIRRKITTGQVRMALAEGVRWEVVVVVHRDIWLVTEVVDPTPREEAVLHRDQAEALQGVADQAPLERSATSDPLCMLPIACICGMLS